MVRGGTPDEARALVRTMGPEGLDILIWAGSPEEADALVKESFSWKTRPA